MRALTATLLVLAAASPAGAAVPRPPDELPHGAQAATAERWIVGARPSGSADALARRFGAEELAPGAYSVAAARARALAAAFARRGILRWSERDRPRATSRVGSDPLSPQAGWRDVVADPELDPPAVGPGSPLLALVDSQIDLSHPEFTGGAITTTGTHPLGDLHGTATTAVAAAPVNGTGIVGVWPGMRALNVSLPQDISCADSTRGISEAIRAGAAVINMSYGSTTLCYAEYVTLQYATAAGVTLVAAAGNEFADGNPLEFPASLPHVVTVAAIGPDGRAAYFSNENAALDLAAPGVAILTAVPPQYDPDGTQDGWAALDGTSFAAPMVAAAAAWVRAARPGLRPDQVAQVVRLSARDLGSRGYDRATGFGLLDVGAALSRRAPPHDPGEPNEDVEWVDGRALGRAQGAVWNGGAPRRRTALLDVFEDPVDVYRVRVPGRARVRVMLLPRFGNPDLRLLGPRARTVRDRRHVIARSRRRGTRRDSVTVVNRSRRTVTAYAVADIRAGRGSLDSTYVLRIARLRSR